MIKNVSIFGFSQTKPDSQEYWEAFETARLLAEKGYTIVNGSGPGIMKAATEGAHAGGGKAIGATFDAHDMTRFVDRDETNVVDELITCRNYVERTVKMLELGDIYVIFNGGTGTISEFGMAWGLARLYFGRHKPLILYGPFWHDILEAFGRGMHLREEELLVYRIVTTPQDVLKEVQEFAQEQTLLRGQDKPELPVEA
jgi:uncharacterized protein (TIGR00730 family)